MESLSTAPKTDEFNTVSTDEKVTVLKNQKVIGLRCSKMLGAADSSISTHWKTIDEYFACDLASSPWSVVLPIAKWKSTKPFEIEKYIEDIFSTYRNENIAHNLNIHNLFIKEYTPHIEMKILDSLVAVGSEIFKDARQRNEVEEKIINDFVRSKSKVLSTTQL